MDRVEKNSGYWSELMADSGRYLKFYNIKGNDYGSVPVRIKEDSVLAHVSETNSSLFDFYGSVFALYLSRIDRLPGVLMYTGMPAKEGEQPGRKTLLRVPVDQESSFPDFLRSFKAAYQEAVEHTDVDVSQYLTEKGSYYSVYDLSDSDESKDANSEDAYALMLILREGAVEIKYNTGLFTETYISHMVKNLESLTDEILRSQECKISDLDILSKEEKECLSEFSKGKTIEVDQDRMFAEAFRSFAAENPNALAVDDGVNKISYVELERSSNSVAYDLANRFHIAPGSRVALMLPRTYHFPELVLALNKIGAAYVPIDTQFPVNRIRHMIGIAGVDHFITVKAIGEKLDSDIRVICLEDLKYDHDVVVEIQSKKEDLFAILFTSGTTGIPKGVMFYNWQFPWAAVALTDVFHTSCGDCMGSFFSFSFVASFVVCAALFMGCSLRLFNEEEQRNSLLLIKALKENHMNSLILPPTVGIPIYEREDLNLDYLVLAGAKLNELSHTERHTKLVNFYGTTETIVAISKIYDLENTKDDRVPLGRPVANTSAYILDEQNRQMPVGVPGEICISGGIMTPGYCNDQELTAKSFVENPYSDCDTNRTMYRTGDIGYYNFDGEIEIIGREDDQLSVRGFRIESGEISAIMKSFPEIADVCLDVENDTLTAYYTLSNKTGVDQKTEDADQDSEQNDDLLENRIREALKRELPYYMIPSLFVKLDKIPLNINGKVDRTGLKRVARQQNIEIKDETLRAVVEAFREVLRLEVVLPDDRFVALGGTSLSAMRLQLLLQDKLKISLSANELIGLSTPEEIADYVRSNRNAHPVVDEKKYSFDAPCPLSESQLNIYLDESVHDRETAYNNPFTLRFKKDGFSADLLKQALQKVFKAFPILKARVLNQDGALSLCFDAEPVITEGSVEEIGSFVVPFKTDECLARFLIARDGEATILCADVHHLIFDGVSLNVFLNSLFSALGEEALDSVDRGLFKELAFEEAVASSGMDEAKAFYREMLADREEAHELLPSVTGAGEDFEYIETFDMDMEQLASFLRKHAITHNQFFAGVFAYTLSRFTGGEKALFNLIEDGRGHVDLSRSIGMYVKTLPVLMDCKDQDMASFLSLVSERINSVMKYDLVPFRILASEFDLTAGILFQYSHAMFTDALNMEGRNIEIEPLKHDLDSELSFNVLNNGEKGLTLRILSSSRYSEEFITRFAKAYQQILRGMMTAERLKEIPYTSEEDISLLNGWNLTEVSLPYGHILEAFRDTLSKYPENKMVVYKDASYTFAEGAFIADRIRQKLLSLGITPEDRVGFLVPRSELYMFSVLGILSTGAAYVPLDENLPDERLSFMIQDAVTGCLIVSDDTQERAKKLAGDGITLFNISGIMKEDIGTLTELTFTPGTIASILYTSGSTGIPKGVKITTGAVLNYTSFHLKKIPLLPGDVCALYASIGFDVSMEVLFSVLSSGACMDIVPEEKKLDIHALNRHFVEHGVTQAHLPAQMARLFIREIADTSLRDLVSGGEKLGQVRVDRDYRITDTYGPTEACITVTCIDLKDKIDPSGIGFVISNMKAYVLDKERRRVPVGAVGELYLSGLQLADGYLNRKEETNRAFLTNPFEDRKEYGIIYATGDVVRVLPDGRYGFIGRRDSQVKIRGNRLELTEVEAVIRKIDGVSDVTAQIRKLDGNNELVVYVVSEDPDNESAANRVLSYLSGRVPEYMVPSFVIRLDSIPVNVNGKVDKRALPEVDFGMLHAEYAAPRNELEERVVREFERVFELEQVGINDDFVRLGGDSLTAVKLVSVLGNTGITVGDILRLRTPAAIADTMKGSLYSFKADLTKYSYDRPCPLSESQLNVYLDESVHEKGTAYNIPYIIRFRENYSPDRIRAALEELLTAYPVLRGRVRDTEGSPAMAYDAEPEIREGSVDEISSFVRPFELEKSLSRFMILREEDATVLCVDFHHLVFDGASMNVFLDSLGALLQGDTIDSVDMGMLQETSLEEFIRSSGMDEALDFYAHMLADRDEVYPMLPSVNGAEKAFESIHTFDIDKKQLDAFLRKHSMTRNQYFMGIFAYTLSRFSGSEKVLFNLIEDGRGHMDLSRSIGMYVKTLPILMDCRNQKVDAFLSYASDLMNSVMKYDLVPFRTLASGYELNAGTTFQYAHSLYMDTLNRYGQSLKLEPLPQDPDAELSFYVFDNEDDGLILRIKSSSRYSEDFIQRFAESYEMILRSMMTAERMQEISYISTKDLSLLNGWNQTEAKLPYGHILEAFRDTLSKYPGNRLVTYKDTSYTFAEGAFIADRIRQKLLSLGITPEDRVGFLVPRSELYVFSVLGILSTGAAYVPLDENLPDERLSFIIRDAVNGCLIVSDDTQERAEKLAGYGSTLFNISGILKEEIGTLTELPFTSGNIAAILYTSGSTGIPKGVKITTGAVLNYTSFHLKKIPLLPGDVCALYASIGFDVSMEVLFSVLSSGACMDIVPEEKKLDIHALNRHFVEHGVTQAHLPAQMARLFIREIADTSLRDLVSGGEKLGRVRFDRDYRITDTYGPTEACITVTCIDLKDKIDPSGIGFVISNMKAYVLDKERRRVPVGAVGELYLSGPQLADGYLNREEETARAFLPNPFEEGSGYYSTFYATGDVVRILPDGSYGFIGRRDSQVKIRGNRLELSEVEALIRKIDGVSDVTARIRKLDGNNELIVYVVTEDPDEEAAASRVQSYLTGRVPDYMIPSFVIRMDSIPLNVNGKVDRRALPEVDFSRLHAEYAAPRNELEARIVREFERVFEMERIGIHDDFMSLGGDSLTAVKLLSGLRDYGIRVADILSLRTPAAIAEGVEELSPKKVHYTLDSGCPLNNSQMTIYKDYEKRRKNDTFMIPVIIPIDKRYSKKQIRRALDIVFKAHPVMSMHVELRDGTPWLVKGSNPEVRKGVTNLANMIRHLEEEFDIFESLSKHVVVRTPRKRYLVSIFHHICFDLISGNVFRREFLNALRGVVPKRVDTDFLKIAAFQQQTRNSEGYDQIMQDARTMLGNRKGVGFYRNPGEMGHAGFIMQELSVSRKQVKRFTDRFGTNKNILFTSALALTLAGLTGKDDVLFGINENGRDRFLSYNAIGLYMNVVPMVAHVDRRNMKTFLKSLSDQYYKYARLSHYPFGPLALELGVSPIILFQFLPEWIIDDGGYDHLPVGEKVLNKIVSTMTDLVVEAHMELVEGKNGYTLRIYHSGYYSRKMIKRLAYTYQETLSRMLRD